ncbi:hypothetical protein [Mycobacterium sp. NPDC050853]|uniref:hypothetical protein n=1 Tax=Mycobacterium sp. NPDC050853 TaxID=3155160 RepID=UPI0033CA9E59
MRFARGGLITGPDPTPIFTETMRFFARGDGYVIPASAVSEAGVRLLEQLNRAEAGTQTDGW